MSLEKIQYLDQEWYAQEYGDVTPSGLTPMDHFRRYGLLLNRKPCRDWVDIEEQDSDGNALKPPIQIQATFTHQVQQLQNNAWISLGDDPFFLMDQGFVASNGPGWYVASLRIKSELKKNQAMFYFDFGNNFNEKDTLRIPYESGEKIYRIFKLDQAPRAIRFDPLATEGAFAVHRLRLEKIDEGFARTKMLERIRKLHPLYVNLDSEHIFTRLVPSSGEQSTDAALQAVKKVYDETFLIDQSSGKYEEWIDQVEKSSIPSVEEIQERMASFEAKPLISIVVPVYNTEESLLRACLDSVLQQSYPRWELCVADDASPLPHVRRILTEYENKDPRVKVTYRKTNGHISEASNSALALAAGDYVALMDHDDVLSEHALFFMVEAINVHPDALILYSDEDKLDALGQRSDPHFKGDWNPDLFFSQNYVSHLGVYQRSLLEKIRGFRKSVEGSQDYDLLLRCLPHVKSEQIVHVPRILYHWRIVDGSTAMAAGEKSYTSDAGLKALRDYFGSVGPVGVKVEPGLVSNTYHVQWPIPESAPMVTLLIPTRDQSRVTEVAVRSVLEKTGYPNYEIIIIDNGSVEAETLQFFKDIQTEDKRVRVIRYDFPFNYSAINNFGVHYAKGSLVGLINNDVEVIAPEWLTEMVRHALRQEIGCVGAKLHYSNGHIQHGGVILGIGGVAGHAHKHFPENHPGYFSRLMITQNFSAVTAACLLVRKEIYQQVSGLNEKDLTVAFNDVDFCLRVMRLGYRNIWTPYARLFHHESISRGSEDNPEKINRFRKEVEFMKKEWESILKKDPYYSPFLSRRHEDFSLEI